MLLFVFIFKQKTAYEMRISDWSSDVCSSDLNDIDVEGKQRLPVFIRERRHDQQADDEHQRIDRHDDGREALHDEIDDAVMRAHDQARGAKVLGSGHYRTPNNLRANTRVNARLKIGRASCRERGCQYV